MRNKENITRIANKGDPGHNRRIKQRDVVNPRNETKQELISLEHSPFAPVHETRKREQNIKKTLAENALSVKYHAPKTPCIPFPIGIFPYPKPRLIVYLGLAHRFSHKANMTACAD